MTMSDAERAYLERHGPAKHRATARLIDDLIDLPALLPLALCQCDEGRHCRMHTVAQNIIERAHYSGRPERARKVVERFVRRIGR